MVSAEAALAIPALLLVLTLCLSALQLGLDRVRCIDSARAVVRELARGESAEAAMAAGRQAAPDGARIETGAAAGEATTTVTAPGPVALRWAVPETSCRAVARMEQVDGAG